MSERTIIISSFSILKSHRNRSFGAGPHFCHIRATSTKSQLGCRATFWATSLFLPQKPLSRKVSGHTGTQFLMDFSIDFGEFVQNRQFETSVAPVLFNTARFLINFCDMSKIKKLRNSGQFLENLKKFRFFSIFDHQPIQIIEIED